MMSDIFNSILGQAKIGLEYSSIGSVPIARKGRFFNEGCLHSVVLFAKYQTSKYPRIYNYFASCCQTLNFLVPFFPPCNVKRRHAQLAYPIIKLYQILSAFVTSELLKLGGLQRRSSEIFEQ